jgi:hypothetical protein
MARGIEMTPLEELLLDQFSTVCAKLDKMNSLLEAGASVSGAKKTSGKGSGRKGRTPLSEKAGYVEGWNAPIDHNRCICRIVSKGVVRQCGSKKKENSLFCGRHLNQLSKTMEKLDITPEEFAENPYSVFKNGFMGMKVPKQENSKGEEVYPSYYDGGDDGNLPEAKVHIITDEDGNVSYNIVPDVQDCAEGTGVDDSVDISTPDVSPNAEQEEEADEPPKAPRRKTRTRRRTPSDEIDEPAAAGAGASSGTRRRRKGRATQVARQILEAQAEADDQDEYSGEDDGDRFDV